VSWLYAWLFWTGVSAGSLTWLLIHHLTLGRWGETWRPLAGSAARALPLLILGMALWCGQTDELYPWDHFPEHRRAIFAPFQVCGRTGFALLIWSVFAFWLSGPVRRQGAAAAGLLSILLLGSMLAFDLVMSLDHHFYSSLFGLLVLLGWALSSLCVLILLSPPDEKRCYDWGGLLLACLMLVTYLDFAQLLILWSGNLPEESGWLQLRVWGAWQPLAATLFLAFSAVPFLLLLVGPYKRKPSFVRGMAGWLLLGCALHAYWLVWPAFSPSLTLAPGAAGAWLLVGGLWLLNFRFWRTRLG
jgi:hypothetical protein